MVSDTQAGAPMTGAAAPTGGDPAQAEALATELSHDLMSPYCPGRTIATCPSPQARKLEAAILEQALEGRSRSEIEAGLAARFPDIRGYVGRPEIIYGTAVVALLAILGLILAARRWVGRSRASTPAAAGLSAAAAGSPAAAVAPLAAMASASASPSASLSAPPAAGGQERPSRREIDALDDELDRIDEF